MNQIKKQKIKLGFTNITYKVTANKKTFVEQYKRSNGFNHRINYKLLKRFSFTPKLLKEDNDKITWEYIEGKHVTTSDYELVGVAKMIREVHDSKLSFPVSNLLDRANEYIRLANNYNSKIIPPELKQCDQDFALFFRDLKMNTPVHCDLWTHNILIDKNKKHFIVDWEYAMMGDRHWDLAYFCESSYLNSRQVKLFLESYGKKIDAHRYKVAVFATNYITLYWLYSQEKFTEIFATKPLIDNMLKTWQELKNN